ncbi:MAG: hypothetical protein A2622_13700 [Bdellovibrionales bacterium RIFCSPHIGHO2_01_FULL_40_29]|nr:MAG: hypothetical protein A2622_13700 [Bdellovibrionales bacterium RIFCSPHIGHO2_01_FULL_40_29]OFZ35205.1 MAG: hypothetical protein A3D17_14350 [Bdellovibrionales bacterium RIFCSPHIGHO2_02_FULL_40_15]
MISDIAWLATEAKKIHEIFSGYFYLVITVLMLLGIAIEYFKWPIGGVPNFGTIVGRALIAALLLHAYPEITNTIADVTDAMAARLGDLNNFKMILDKMGDKVGELSWSWVSFKETIMLLISFLTFFILYFSIHIADSFYIYVWVMLYVFSPLLIALYVLPVTASATSALFRSLIEVACWKIVWSVIATLLWSSALSQINQDGTQVSFLTAIGFNIILAGSLLLTPFIVHALAGSGLSAMGKDLSSLAIGGMTISPSRTIGATKSLASKTISNGKSYFSKSSGNKSFNKKNQKHSANNKSQKQIKA